jgi:hypothetical protein
MAGSYERTDEPSCSGVTDLVRYKLTDVSEMFIADGSNKHL